MEIRVPSIDGEDVIGTQRALLDTHIAETDSKMSKIAREIVFSDIVVHNIVDGTQAITLEFMNERNYDTYMTVIADFRAWAVANHNVEYVFEKTSSASYSTANIVHDIDSESDGLLHYLDSIKKYMNITLPTERGFL